MAMKSFAVASLLVAQASAIKRSLQDPTLDEYKEDKAEQKAAGEAVAAKDAKMAAVGKVITMMEDLQKQVLAEGEAEAQTYNKFSCFCKDTSADKSAAIQKGKDEVAALSATIESLASDRDGLDERIAGLEADIVEAEKIMAETKATRKADLSVYEKNAADLSGALVALESAIKALKASAKPSLVQMQEIQKTVETATLLADALGMKSAEKAAAIFIQQPDVPMENYKFHSGGIIETLEGLLKDFRAEKVSLDEEEVKSVATYDSKIQEQTDIVKAKNLELTAAQKSKANKQEEIAENSELRSTTAAVLLDDQKYLMELGQMCSDKAKTWDQRTKVRQDELSAITSAMAIIKSTVAEKTQAATIRFAQQGVAVKLAHVMAQSPAEMEALEAEAEQADADAPAFLQTAAVQKAGFLSPTQKKDGRQIVIDLLKSKGAQLKSTLLTSLASHVAEDPFAKVKVLIQELVERLLKEANSEANQKGWCDKATKDATQKKDYAAGEVEELNGEMATLEALIDKLTEELATLDSEIQELKDNRADAEALRAEEKAENAHTVSEAEAGLEAVLQAIDILKKFYATVAKEKVELVQKGPEDDAPDAGFKNFESYNGAQAENGGIVGMLEVIQSDFERTISETKKAEAQAEQDHLKFMTETGVSLAEKETAHQQKTSENEAAKEKLSDATENFKSQAEILRGAVKELLDLKPVCVDTGMSYEERVARREDEIAALKKADCILGAYAEYGPEGLADAC